MNINEINKVRAININQLVGEVKADGTFKEILDAVMEGKIVPLINDRGDIIGGSYNMPAKDLIEDNVNKIRFERRYAFKPIMSWVCKALEIMVKPETQVYGIQEVREEGDDISVILSNGEVIVVSEAAHEDAPADDGDGELPTRVCLDDYDLDPLDSDRAIKRVLKKEFGHFLAKGFNVTDNLHWDDDAGWVLIDIKWGRKASASELN